MFFFFAGGVNQQVRHVLKSSAGGCIACRSPVDLVEYEKVLKVLFVPVWKRPGKEPVMHCNNCDLFFPPSYSISQPQRQPQPQPPPPPPDSPLDALRCQFCSREVDPDFKYCPFCGSLL